MKWSQLLKLSASVLLVGTFATAHAQTADDARFVGTPAVAEASRSTIRPEGQGLPLPWPFPWAKECPVNWESMAGRYLLSDNEAHEQIDLKITVIERYGFKLIRVSRYSPEGRMLADGFTFLRENQRSISLWLYPVHAGEPMTWAELKLYHRSAVLVCSEETLIPILMLEEVDHTTHKQVHYRLVRVL